ncbi:hypothetical protein RGQ13_17775 [Thalassotalea psychrophila]|uniref:DUF3718 domain-containing protein n=1 Tax=Thalassotalea psychrophila TaxID=3065647 RepID=A0ABY9TW53_9GAMM|nr:hypothetical protein RGQ13_17775 [Colwelliaceae bacterium SQ149]
MKVLTTVTLFIIVFTLFSSKVNAANITFKAGDDSLATKLCLAAVSNDLQKTKRYISRLALMTGINTGMYGRTNFASDDIRCNDTDLVKFTAQYNAKDTFEFINKRAMKKYRLNTDEVKVIDLARQNSMNNTPQVIVITSR